MKKIFIAFTAAAALGLGSCKKDLLDINQNPNSATYSTPQLTMPVALDNAARVTMNSGYISLGWWLGLYGGASGFSKPNVEYTYDVNAQFLSGNWDYIYNNIADFNYIEQTAAQQGLPVYQAVAKIMKAYDYQHLVDLWGNVPYSQSMAGANNLSPAYDNAQVIYEDLVKQLDSAVAILKKPSTLASINFSTDRDRIIAFGSVLNPNNQSTGSVFLDRWRRFANTLKLRLLINQSQMPGRSNYITTNLAGLTRSDFLDIGMDVVENPGYANSVNKFPPLYGLLYSAPGTLTDLNKSTRAGDFAIQLYNSTNDPRVSFYYNSATTPYKGSVLGDPVGTPGAASLAGGSLLSPLSPGIIFPASESLFLQAEAVQRGYLNYSTAKQLYQDAITASFQYAGLSAGDAATYYSQNDPNVNWDLATNKIQLIITQKYLALNDMDILAIYDDYRRTGYPANIPLSTDANSKGKIPLRLLYPQRETQLNTANVAAQGTIDPFTTKIFWMP